jgi:outer membrane protein assembly factor BamB
MKLKNRRDWIFLLVAFLVINNVCAGVKEINPVPLLTIEGLGNGYSTPAVTSDRIFVTGERDGKGYLFSYDFNGALLWKTEYGNEWSANFPGSRASPSVIDSTIYTSSGMGDIACFNANTGQKQWTVNMISDLHGVNAVFGYSMSVLIEKERIYCLPGGPDTNIVCMDRFTEKIIWKSAGDGETPGYTAPLFFRHHERNLLVTFSELAMHGLDAETGELLWTYDLSLKGDVPCNSPIYSEGFLYIVAGGGNGAVKFEISQDGTQIKKIWSNDEFNTYFGGFIMIGNFLYGSSKSKPLWMSVDVMTGKNVDSLSFKTGSVVQAGEGLVVYSQTGGVGLVRPDQGEMILDRSFKIVKGTKEHFSHPLLAGGRLYIRHGDALLVYDYQQLAKL